MARTSTSKSVHTRLFCCVISVISASLRCRDLNFARVSFLAVVPGEGEERTRIWGPKMSTCRHGLGSIGLARVDTFRMSTRRHVDTASAALDLRFSTPLRALRVSPQFSKERPVAHFFRRLALVNGRSEVGRAVREARSLSARNSYLNIAVKSLWHKRRVVPRGF
jgi:hypothetical protein